jgi:hypothetical protein
LRAEVRPTKSIPSRRAKRKAAMIAVLLESLEDEDRAPLDEGLVGELVVDQERGEEERRDRHSVTIAVLVLPRRST